MKKTALVFTLLTLVFPQGAVNAAAPVVDDSQNYALLEEQQMASDRAYEENDIPIAKDNEPLELQNQQNVNLLNKVQGLQQEIQELRGQLDQQSNTIKQLKEQQLRFYKDIDTRLSSAKIDPNAPKAALNLDNSTASLPVKIETQQPFIQATKTSPADEQLSYLAAYDLVKEKRFDEALASMQSFVNRYPHGGYTANAHYWLGELHMVKKNYSQAITQFETVLKNFPTSSKAAACTLKIGYALAASGKQLEARKRLQQVITNYPDTPTAQLAQIKLQTLTST